ncbi:MAG: cytochrome P460 family protein [Devosiaceae bacterium]|nr:cytochrome P460 family protein [Devosiaceae bacterium]
MKIVNSFAKLAGVAAIVGASMSGAFAQMAPFGNDEDVSYAAQLWAAMEAINLAGPDAIRSYPYEGVEPHGFVLETLYAKATLGDLTGDLVVKRNYGPAGVEIEAVQANAAQHLGAVTVMFKREAGYDDENNNWFYAKYLPDGSLDKNPAGVELAGRVAKGMDQGCIACHSAAPGEDFIFTTDHIK